jgi:hypothetical protein
MAVRAGTRQPQGDNQLAHLHFRFVLRSLLLLRTVVDFPLPSPQADNLKAQAVCTGTLPPHRLQVIRPPPHVNLQRDRLPACQACRLVTTSPTLAREAALFLRRPERLRRNSHTEPLHFVQGGRTRPWSFVRRSRGIQET